MSTVEAAGGAVYDRGYRPYEGARGRRGAATLALYRASMRRALGLRRSWRQKIAPFVLLGVVTIPAIVNVGIGYVTRDSLSDRIEIITYRDYVGVSAALLLFVALVAPDVMCPDRRQRVLPLMFARPLMGSDYVAAKVGAIASIVFAFSFLPQVVLFVGNVLVSDSSLDYFTGHLDILWKVPVAVVLLAVYYAVIGVAIAAMTDRRIVAGAAVIGLFLVTSISSGIIVGEDYQRDGGSIGALINVLSLPLYLRDLVFLGHIDPESPLTDVSNGGLLAIATYVVILAAAMGAAASPLPLGGALMSTAAPQPVVPANGRRDPAFVADATVEIDNVSVWFGPKVALSELSCSFGPGVTGLLGPNGAGKTTLMRAMTGMVSVNQGTVRIEGRDPRTDRQVHARMSLVPEDEAVPAGLTAHAVRPVRRRSARHRRPRGSSRKRCMPSRCSMRPTARSTRSARACANAPRSQQPWSATHRCWCSTNP